MKIESPDEIRLLQDLMTKIANDTQAVINRNAELLIAAGQGGNIFNLLRAGIITYYKAAEDIGNGKIDTVDLISTFAIMPIYGARTRLQDAGLLSDSQVQAIVEKLKTALRPIVAEAVITKGEYKP